MIKYLREIYDVISPYGRLKLGLLGAVMVGQVMAQTLSLLSVFAFISILSSPDFINLSGAGKIIHGLLDAELSRYSLAICGALVAATVTAASAFSAWAEYYRTRSLHDIGRWLRHRMMQDILAREYRYFLTASPSVLTKKVVQDVMTFVQQVLLPLFEIVVRGLFAIALMAWLAVLSLIAFTAILVFAGLYYVVILRTMRVATRRVSDAIKQETREVYSAVGQTFSGIKAILAGNLQTYFEDRCDGPSTRLARSVPRVVLLAAIPRYILEAAVFVGFVALVLIYRARGISVADLAPTVAVFALIMYRLAPSVQIIVSQSISMISMRQSLEEIVEELHVLPAAIPVMPKTSGEAVTFTRTLRLEHVSFFYQDDGRRGVNDISMEIPYGAHVALVGSTGCGKSTLVDLIIGLLAPESGRITVDGKQLNEIDLNRWRSQIGYVPQDQFILDATIAENIALGQSVGQIDMDAVSRAARYAQAEEFITRELPFGYDTMVGERGLSLSGGQRQRLGIARALYRRPGLLILDEATSALDSVTERAIVERLRELEFNPTVVTISHRLSTIRDCEKVFLLEAGVVVAQGSFDELYSESEQFRLFFETHQMKVPDR